MEYYTNAVKVMKTLCNKSHTNMIQYIGDGMIVSGSYFIDMELCDINLSQYIEGTHSVAGVQGLPVWNKENPDVFLIVAIMQQLLSGLAFMHKKDKVHRDLNPRNGKTLRIVQRVNI
jgi:serine/threonine protein kinase